VTLGTPRLHFRVTDSTNERARALAVKGAPHGTLVTADSQSAGRGRQGRTWIAPPRRALLCSFVIRDPARLLPLAAGVAVAQTVGPQALLKWPNDVLLDGRKVAGILVEGRPQQAWAVLGVGINVALGVEDFPAELHGRAGGLGKTPAEIEPTLTSLIESLRRWLDASAGDVLAAWRERDALAGREVSWAGRSGWARGVDELGRLRVEVDGETTTLEAGEVHLASG
jgi:BirA family biotin operon repressor/biotin-[acetyl-CoA-carboxylase] ligase